VGTDQGGKASSVENDLSFLGGWSKRRGGRGAFFETASFQPAYFYGSPFFLSDTGIFAGMFAETPENFRQRNGSGKNCAGLFMVSLCQSGAESPNVHLERAGSLTVGKFLLNASLFQIFESVLFHEYLQIKRPARSGEIMAIRLCSYTLSPLRPARIFSGRAGRRCTRTPQA
jgi:hypothetical protein